MWDPLVRDLRTDFPGAPMELVPAARALARLERAVLAGKVPGFKTLQDLFEDDIHPTPVGKCFAGALHYAMLTGRSPVARRGDLGEARPKRNGQPCMSENSPACGRMEIRRERGTFCNDHHSFDAREKKSVGDEIFLVFHIFRGYCFVVKGLWCCRRSFA